MTFPPRQIPLTLVEIQLKLHALLPQTEGSNMHDRQPSRTRKLPSTVLLGFSAHFRKHLTRDVGSGEPNPTANLPNLQRL